MIEEGRHSIKVIAQETGLPIANVRAAPSCEALEYLRKRYAGMRGGRLKPHRDSRTLPVKYTPELYARAAITAATALMWVPYVI